jgi:hypothetical protein
VRCHGVSTCARRQCMTCIHGGAQLAYRANTNSKNQAGLVSCVHCGKARMANSHNRSREGRAQPAAANTNTVRRLGSLISKEGAPSTARSVFPTAQPPQRTTKPVAVNSLRSCSHSIIVANHLSPSLLFQHLFVLHIASESVEPRQG